MTRLRGRAPRGERCRASVPHGHWKTTTFTGALRLSGMTAPFVLDGPMDGPAFLAYVRQILAPTLRPGDVVIMDNLPAHKVSGVRELIQVAGAELRYLPPYSPDFNPIEMVRTALEPMAGGSHSRNLKLCSEKLLRPQRKGCGLPSLRRSKPSRKTNAGTTSLPPDMTVSKLNLL